MTDDGSLGALDRQDRCAASPDRAGSSARQNCKERDKIANELVHGRLRNCIGGQRRLIHDAGGQVMTRPIFGRAWEARACGKCGRG